MTVGGGGGLLILWSPRPLARSPPRRRGLPLSLLRGVPIGVLLNFVFF